MAKHLLSKVFAIIQIKIMLMTAVNQIFDYHIHLYPTNSPTQNTRLLGHRCWGRYLLAQRPFFKFYSFIIRSCLRSPGNIDYSTRQMVKPEHCIECSWFFDKMGACLPPGVSPIYSYLSLIPYFIIFLYAGLTIFTMKQGYLKMCLLLISSYIVGDRLLKNMFQSLRPEGACKDSFGFPSSHMVVITCFAIKIGPYSTRILNLLWIALVVAQGFARISLQYHTKEQVIGGVVFAAIYTFLFDKAYNKIYNSLGWRWSAWSRKLRSALGIKEDEQVEQQGKQKQG